MDHQELDVKSIHEKYGQPIRQYLQKLTGNDDVDDLTQETFINVTRALHSFRGQSSLWTWIYKIATNTAIDHLRRKKTGKDHSVDDALETVEDQNVWTGEKTGLDDHVIRKEMNECIRSVVSRLPETYRTVIVLSEFEGFKNEDISRILGLGLETVKIRLHRARLKLKDELSKQCILYHDERNEFACERKDTPLVRKDQILSLVKK